MSRYELDKLNNIVMRAAKAVYDNEKFAVGMLSSRAKKLAQLYPHDTTVVGCSNFLSKRASANNIWISRAELKNVYSKLFRSNNKFAVEFKNELGLVEHDPRTLMQRDVAEGENLVAEAYESLGDSLLAEQIESALSNDKSFKLYSSDTAKNATKTCARELNSLGILPKNIMVVAGQSDILICQATYETPKGQSNVLIPVEIRDGHALMPSMFLGVNGFVNLNNNTLQEHLVATAGKSFKVDVQKLLEKISEAKNGKLSLIDKPLSEVERAVIKVASTRQTSVNQTPNAVILQEVDLAEPNVKTTVLEAPKEAQTIANLLVSNSGAAEFIFGKDIVRLGMGLIINELRSAGYNNVQVTVSDNTKESISYAVAIDNKIGFTVPVKVINKKPYLPKVVIASGKIFEMSSAGISSLLSEGNTDSNAVAMTSSFYGIRASELVERIREAMRDDNFPAAEDALHVLKNSNDDVAYRAGLELYRKGLNGEPVEPKHTCATPVKLASSKYLVCSHTGLPVHQVYTDKHGNCQPLYRKKMAESSEGGVSTITSRIYFE